MADSNKVLVVDDHVAMRHYWNLALKQLGIESDVAEDGDQAVAMALKGAYALILMDIQMPRMSGLEATQAIRDFEKESGVEPAVIVAVTSGAATEATCIGAGMNHYFEKPFKLEDVHTILAKVAPILLTE